MSRPDAAAPIVAQIAASPRLPTGADGPVFAEPWQAEAFALTIQLHAGGAFTWPQWAQALSDALKAAEARGEPDDGSRYYEHWLAALERLVADRGLVSAPERDARKAAWAEAYRRTPHGKPVNL